MTEYIFTTILFAFSAGLTVGLVIGYTEVNRQKRIVKGYRKTHLRTVSKLVNERMNNK